MAPIPQYPKLRWPLDVRMDSCEGQRILIINCPLGVSPEPLVLVAEVAPIVSSLDGTLSLDDLYKKFSPYGVKETIIDELVSLLDTGLFLTSPGFFAAEQEMKEQYHSSPVRPPALSGRGYAASKALLETEIDAFLESGPVVHGTDPAKLVCLKSPHIDYRRGGLCYGKTYSFLRGAPHDLYVLIGTSHMYSKHMFHLSKKHFQNPLGMLQCDLPFMETLAKRYGEKRSFDDEFLHKREHSLELQIPFMSRVLREPKIAPILVGGFHTMVQSGKAPQQFEVYETFAAALSETVREQLGAGKSVCFIAGVDMAHIGQHFGDPENLTPDVMIKIEARDKEYLEMIATRNKERLWAHIAEDNDARRICGFPTMYTILDVLDRLAIATDTTLYEYRQAVDYATDCAVTFAGLGMYRQ